MSALDAASLLRPFSPLTRQSLCHSCRCPDTWTLVVRVSVSRIVGHWAEKAAVLSTHWIVSETPVSAIRFGHLGSSWCPASCHSHFPCSFKSAHCPPSSRCPQGPPVLGHLGTARPSSLGHSLFSVQRPPVLAPNLSPLRTPVPLCVSLLGATLQLAIEHKRVPRVLPRSTLLGPTWTPDTYPHTQ